MVGEFFGVSTCRGGGDGGADADDVVVGGSGGSPSAGGAGRLRIDGLKTGFGLNATKYSSVSLRFFPAQSEMSFSTLLSVRWGARRAATVRLMRLSASAMSN